MDVFALWEEIGAPEQAHQARGEQKSLKGSAAQHRNAVDIHYICKNTGPPAHYS